MKTFEFIHFMSDEPFIINMKYSPIDKFLSHFFVWINFFFGDTYKRFIKYINGKVRGEVIHRLSKKFRHISNK